MKSYVARSLCESLQSAQMQLGISEQSIMLGLSPSTIL